jgi:hypothetical protein
MTPFKTRVAVLRLPEPCHSFICCGCGPCGAEVEVELTARGVEEAQAFLREHAACLYN